jgi:conserved oligomeric Golgi complex subunit 3
VQKVGSAPRPLNQQAFAVPEKLGALVAAVNQALDTTYPAAVNKLRLYLGKPKMQAALLKPIRSNISEAHAHIEAVLRESYTAEGAARVPLRSGPELQALLDAAG